MANRLVSAAGVEPINRAAAAGYDSETIRQLVEDSTQAGVLDVDAGSQMARFIGLESLTVDDVLATRSGAPTQVPTAATAADVQRAAQTSGHLRILIGPEASASPMVVHVRDTLQAEGDELTEGFARPALAVEAGTSVYEVFRRMRENSEQLVVVRTDERFTGVITWADVLKQVWLKQLSSTLRALHAPTDALGCSARAAPCGRERPRTALRR